MLRLNHTSLHKIKLHAMRTYPEECCGMLLGKRMDEEKFVCDILSMNNTMKEDHETRYLITPEEYKKAEELASQEDVSLIGMYHSHPDHPARPSQFDLEHAMPWWSYVIVSVQEGQPAAIKSWVLRDDRSMFDEENLHILDGEFKHLC